MVDIMDINIYIYLYTMYIQMIYTTRGVWSEHVDLLSLYTMKQMVPMVKHNVSEWMVKHNVSEWMVKHNVSEWLNIMWVSEWLNIMWVNG